MEDEGLSAHERVAKMVVDHLIDFKGCRQHTWVMGDGITGMEEFVKNRRRLRQRIPGFEDPDFAQVEQIGRAHV